MLLALRRIGLLLLFLGHAHAACPSGALSLDGPGQGTNCSCQTGHAPDVTTDTYTNRGYDSTLDECIACEAGKHKAKRGPAACEDCATGFWAAAAASSCWTCKPGQYLGVAYTQGICYNCTAGFFSASSSTHCRTCWAGSYNALQMQTTCSNCSSGTFSAVVGAKTAAVCSACLAGSHAPVSGHSACNDCLPGEYSGAGAANCSSCPRGKFSTAYGTLNDVLRGIIDLDQDNNLDLEEFMKGFVGSVYSSAQVIALFASIDLNKNGRLTMTADSVSPSEVFEAVSSQLLPAREAAAADSVCQQCLPASYGPRASASSCSWCEAGTYSKYGATECTNCVAGKYFPASGLALQKTLTVAISWFNLSELCYNCSAGNWSYAGSPQCTACKSGTYSAAQGVQAFAPSVCSPCLPGTFSGEGAASCEDCPTGTYALAGAAACIACPRGKASSAQGIGASGPWVCRACALGYSTRNQTASSACSMCAPGSFADETGFPVCSLCLPGSYQAAEGETGCIFCAINTYTNFSGASACEKCPFGKYSRPASEELEDCRSGEINLTPDQAWGDILEQAEDFVVIFMRPGYYTGYCDLKVKALRIEGIEGANKTLIDCANSGRIFAINNTRNLTLIGLSLVAGTTSGNGGCMHVENSGLTIRESQLIDCRALGDGGAMWVGRDSLLTVIDCIFSTASSRRSGGLLHMSHNSSGELINVHFSKSDALEAGGAIAVEHDSHVRVENAVFSLHQATGGGAISVTNRSSASVYNGSFSNCVAYGGLVADASEDEEFDFMVGGGVMLLQQSSRASLFGCTVSGALSQQDGGVVRLASSCSIHLSSSSFVGNSAQGQGGVARIGPHSSVSGHDNLFEFNRALRGGGVFAWSSRAADSKLSDSRFSFNSLGCMGCAQQKEHVFGICLDHNQALRERYDVFLLQPCRGFSCNYVKCWGLAYAKWGQDCSMEGGGWQASGKDSCGADSYPWVPFALPNVHWDAVQRALEGPS